MGPNLAVGAKAGAFDPRAMDRQSACRRRPHFRSDVAAIAAQADEYAPLIGDMSEHGGSSAT